MERKLATVDGIRMSWVEHGSGPAVVFIHGIPTSPLLWRHVLPRLNGVRSLAWEMVGYGGSIPEGRRRDISVARQADYLVSWMRFISVPAAVMVGHDLGGGVAQIAAVRNRDACRGLLLTNSIGYDSWPIPSVRAMQLTAPAMRHLPTPAFKLLVRSLIWRGHDSSAEAKASYDLHIRPYLKTEAAAALVRQVESLRTGDTLEVADQLKDLHVPATVVWGVADQFQKVQYAERFSADLRAPLVRIEQGKHFTPEDHPDVLADEILRLVAGAGV